MASKRPLFVTLLCLVLTLSGLVSVIIGVCAIIRSSSSYGDTRTKRSASTLKEHQDTFLFRRALHKVSWTSTARLDPDWRPSEFDDVTIADDIFISVKTSKKFHESRLKVILDTWFNLAPNKIWFFSDDASDLDLSRRTRGHLTDTKCPDGHNRSALCCKMAAEIAAFVASHERWFCHFDDDNYVNLPALVKMLNGYNAKAKWYLGKPSIQKPLEVFRRTAALRNNKAKFQFATGGAGFCLSRPLAVLMKPLVDNGELVATCEEIRLPDDVTVGYLAEHVLGTPLTVVEAFHSHLEPLRMIREKTFRDQITFSYGEYDTVVDDADPFALSNVVDVDQSGKDDEEDPTRFRAVHCHLFPDLCRPRQKSEP